MENKKTNSFITYEVSLYFEKDSELKIKNLIRQIADITQNFYRIEKEIPPHITLGMFKASENQEPSLIKIVQQFNSFFQNTFSQNEKEIIIKDSNFFKRKIFYLQFQQNNNIISKLNELLHFEFLKDFSPANNKMYLPSFFYPHCTIATGLSFSQIKLINDNKDKFSIPYSLFIDKISLAKNKSIIL